MLVSLGAQTRRLLASGLCGVKFPVVARLSWRRGVLTVVWITPDSVKGAPSVFEVRFIERQETWNLSEHTNTGIRTTRRGHANNYSESDFKGMDKQCTKKT